VDDLVRRDDRARGARAEGCRMTPNQIDEVILVGGMTRVPRVQALVKELFGREPHRA